MHEPDRKTQEEKKSLFPTSGRRGDWQRTVRQVGILTTIPFILLAAPLVCFLIGSYLQRRLGVGDWLTGILVILGLIAGGLEVYKLIIRASRD